MRCSRLFGGQRQGLVVAVGVKGLRSSEHGGECLQSGADDVVLGLLRGQRRAGGLGVEAEHPGARVLGAELVAHDVRPNAAGGAEFGDFFEEIVMRVEEEGEARSEVVDSSPASSAACT
jgi:hypothetical protein